jgi:hypothetical protein
LVLSRFDTLSCLEDVDDFLSLYCDSTFSVIVGLLSRVEEELMGGKLWNGERAGLEGDPDSIM